MKALNLDILPIIVFIIFMIICIFTGHKNTKTQKSGHIGSSVA
jgi:hypothetical protein